MTGACPRREDNKKRCIARPPHGRKRVIIEDRKIQIERDSLVTVRNAGTVDVHCATPRIVTVLLQVSQTRPIHSHKASHLHRIVSSLLLGIFILLNK